MRLYVLAAAAAAAVSVTPAQAVAIDVSSGFTPFFNSRTVVGTNYVDTFTFTTTTAKSISGTVGTHWLRDTTKNPPILLSDLDFVSVFLNGVQWSPSLMNTDVDEDYNLNSQVLQAGNHTLTVTYDVDTVTPGSPAGYSGTITLGNVAAVPEPAAWAMMLGGFGLMGGAMRSQRRRTSVAFG